MHYVPDNKHQTNTNLPHSDDGIVDSILAEEEYKGRRILGSPIRKLPNVRSFKVEISGWDKLAAEYGLEKRQPPKIEVEKYTNKGINRYLEHQVRRMQSALQKHNRNLFWTIGMALIKRSNCYLMSAMHRVHENWHRRLKLGTVLAIAREVKRISREKLTEVDFSRTYIPKPNGTSRSLGVPTPPWRVYLHMLNNILVMGLKHKLSPSQHGFQPGKGTLTAWKEVLSRTIKYENIWEFDLKDFFPSVNRGELLDILQIELPGDIWRLIKAINESDPKLPEDPTMWKADESRATHQKTAKALRDLPGITPGQFFGVDDENLKRMEALGRMLDAAGDDDVAGEAAFELWKQDPNIKIDDEITETLREEAWNEWGYSEDVVEGLPGLPQGAPTSPFLSLLVLEPTIMSYVPKPGNVVMYADDGVMAWDGRNFSIPPVADAFSEYGVEFNLEKSAWVKKDGKWLKPLKFLGLEYDGNLDELSAHTRNGSNLILDPQIREWMLRVDNPSIKWGQHFMLRDRPPGMKTGSPGMEQYMLGESHKILSKLGYDKRLGLSWEQLVKSSVLGFVASRLYQGSWHMDIEQQFDLTYKEGSWVEWWNENVTGDDRVRVQKVLNSYPSSGYPHKGKEYKLAESAFGNLGLTLDVFNSTSIAARSVLNILRKANRK